MNKMYFRSAQGDKNVFLTSTADNILKGLRISPFCCRVLDQLFIVDQNSPSYYQTFYAIQKSLSQGQMGIRSAVDR